jgi:HAD superfamily hydrolase (TIGR01662 family)
VSPPSVVAVVIPTVGRPSLAPLLAALAADAGTAALGQVVVVDDRRWQPRPLRVETPPALRGRLRVVRGHGAGPAAARNVGWRSTSSEWVAFLDDDVVLPPGWTAGLLRDIEDASPRTAAVQGRIDVPLPSDRRPTDWERNVAGLERARWATADLVARREALVGVGGFDERFTRAYREDADLALRLEEAGWSLVTGRRRVIHPARPALWHVSVGLQQGNREDPWMRARHGRDWRARAGVPRGRLPRHRMIVAAATVAALGVATGRRRWTAAGLVGWSAGTAELALARTRPGPRAPREIAAMAATSVALPFAATAWWLRGALTVPARARRPASRPFPDAVLFDRDGTLVTDVPYNGDPGRVALAPEAREAVRRLRERNVPVAMITNQSGIARGLLTPPQVDAVNAEVAELVGAFDAIEVCPHGPDDGCDCRKPAGGMVRSAAQRLGVEPTRCVVIGDIGADMGAAEAAGARGVMVPTAATLPEEVAAAPEVAPDLVTAVEMALGERTAPRTEMPARPATRATRRPPHDEPTRSDRADQAVLAGPAGVRS